jgi:hypothetical protein
MFQLSAPLTVNTLVAKQLKMRPKEMFMKKIAHPGNASPHLPVQK